MVYFNLVWVIIVHSEESYISKPGVPYPHSQDNLELRALFVGSCLKKQRSWKKKPSDMIDALGRVMEVEVRHTHRLASIYVLSDGLVPEYGPGAGTRACRNRGFVSHVDSWTERIEVNNTGKTRCIVQAWRSVLTKVTVSSGRLIQMESVDHLMKLWWRRDEEGKWDGMGGKLLSPYELSWEEGTPNSSLLYNVNFTCSSLIPQIVSLE